MSDDRLRHPDSVLVLGAGVSGLTTALCLADQGSRPVIWTDRPTMRTTSTVAAALWFPYLARPEERVAEWSLASYERFRELRAEPAAGILWTPGRWLLRDPQPPPLWADAVDDFRPLPPSELPSGYRCGYAWTAPVIETPRYLPYLLDRLEAAGVPIVDRRLESLEEALDACPRVANCTGLGARELVGDVRLRPVKGQVVKVEGVEVEEFLQDDDNPDGLTYVIPRSRDVVVGGTSVEGDESRTEDPAATAAILQRAREHCPTLAGARVTGVAVGLRPVRDEVRVEREDLPTGVVVHDYGHGGAGITLSWGCALEAAGLLAS